MNPLLLLLFLALAVKAGLLTLGTTGPAPTPERPQPGLPELGGARGARRPIGGPLLAGALPLPSPLLGVRQPATPPELRALVVSRPTLVSAGPPAALAAPQAAPALGLPALLPTQAVILTPPSATTPAPVAAVVQVTPLASSLRAGGPLDIRLLPGSGGLVLPSPLPTEAAIAVPSTWADLGITLVYEGGEPRAQVGFPPLPGDITSVPTSLPASEVVYEPPPVEPATFEAPSTWADLGITLVYEGGEPRAQVEGGLALGEVGPGYVAPEIAISAEVPTVVAPAAEVTVSEAPASAGGEEVLGSHLEALGDFSGKTHRLRVNSQPSVLPDRASNAFIWSLPARDVPVSQRPTPFHLTARRWTREQEIFWW